MNTRIAGALLFAAAAAACSSGSDDSGPPAVSIANGALQGARPSGAPGAVFEGIPFAQPPVGSLRWTPPQPAQSWQGTKVATAYGSACVQTFDGINVSGSEDCLYLNVWTPEWPITGKHPVMLWLYGGSNTGGSANNPQFDGSALAKQGVVVVTANYRLGVMGFLAHPALDAESTNHSSGNYALLDQLMALRWIQQNIGAFGGDPANVTLFGQSSGGFDVLLLVTSPLSTGLFHRAISESGQVLSYGGSMSKTTAEAMGQNIATALAAPQGSSASTLAYLRSIPANQVVAGAGKWTSGTATLPGTTTGLLTAVDGWVLPDIPGRVFSEGKEMAIPLMVGNNAREIMPESLFPGYTTANLVADVSTFYGPIYGPMALAAYGLSNGGTGISDPLYGNAGAQFWTDTVQRCAAIMEADWHSAAKNPTFEYQFDHAWPNQASAGATHGAEVPYVFGTLSAVTPAESWTALDFQTSTQMQEYWTNFAKTGNPNGSSLPTWPPAGSGQFLEFTATAGPQTAAGLQPTQCGIFTNWENEQLSTASGS